MPEIQTRAPSQNLLRQPPQTLQVQDMGFWLSPAAAVQRHCTVTHLETVKSLQLLESPCPAGIAGVFLIWCNLCEPCAMDPNQRCSIHLTVFQSDPSRERDLLPVEAATGGPMTPRCAGLCAHSVARLSQVSLRTLLCKGQAHSLVLD